MEKRIEYYVHLYGIGTEVIYRLGDRLHEYRTTVNSISERSCNIGKKSFPYCQDAYMDTEITLCLRPLSSMTEEEFTEMGSMPSGLPPTISAQPERSIMNNAERTRYLLSKHFDIFGLKESGIAIYEEDLTKEERKKSEKEDYQRECDESIKNHSEKP